MNRKLLITVVAVGFLLRLGVAAKLGLSETPAPGSDGQEFDIYAWNLAQGRGYRGISPDVTDRDHLTAYRVPGTSLVWAGLYRVFGHRYDVVRITHCLIGAGTILLVYGVGRMCFDESAARVATVAYAVYPTAMLHSGALLSESLATLWFTWFVLACLQFAAKPTLPRAAWAGVLLGLAMLTRASAVFMVPLAVVWALAQFRRQQWALALAIPVVSVMTLIPWAARNYRIFGAFIPLSTQGGSALLQGNNRIVATDPSLYGYSIWDTKIPEYHDALKAQNDELRRDKLAMRLAIEWLKDNPGKWPYLVQAKLRRGFTPFLQPTSPKLYRIGMLISWGPVLLLFGAAFFPTLYVFLKQSQPGWVLHLGVLHYAINTVVFFGYSRYRYPIEGLCLVLASAAAVWLWRRLSVRRAPVTV